MPTPNLPTSHQCHSSQHRYNSAAWVALALSVVVGCGAVYGVLRARQASHDLEMVVALVGFGGALALIIASYALTSRCWRFAAPRWPAQAALVVLALIVLLLLASAM